MTRPLHHPFYCEENVWHLCQTFPVHSTHPQVVFVSNPDRTVLFCNQRAGDERGLVVWDYHVLLLVNEGGWQVWDLDARSGFPQPLPAYLAGAFPFLSTPSDDARRVGEAQLWTVPPEFVPVFRVIGVDRYVAEFSSDRRHMRDDTGGWTKPPPPWACIGEGHTLDAFIDCEGGRHGEVLDFEAFVERYASLK